MTIDKVVGGFTGFDIECDTCGKTQYLDFDWESFREAVAEAKENGWRSYKDEDGEWRHKCPECQRKRETQNDPNR
jgi:hypothetical protein